jgi:hypothetical protein
VAMYVYSAYHAIEKKKKKNLKKKKKTAKLSENYGGGLRSCGDN